MKTISLLLIVSLPIFLFAQLPTPTTISYEMQVSNSTIVTAPCSTGRGMIVTPEALNTFFGNKIANYLSEGSNISLFKTYATLNSADGKLSLNRNFLTSTKEGQIRGFTTIGTKLNLDNGLATIFSGKKFSNEIGATFKYTWIGKGSVFFDKCVQQQGFASGAFITSKQKQRMNIQRAYIIETLKTEMNNKAKDFENSISNIKKEDVDPPGVDKAKANLRDKFYTDLKSEYLKKFAEMQSDALDEENGYNKITDHWISLSAYIPVTRQTFNVAESYNSNFSEKSIYPAALSLSYNYIIESRKYGSFFFFLNGAVMQNDRIKTEELDKTSFIDYFKRSGIDTLNVASLKSDDVYVGKYDNFFTPSLSGQFVWFFPRTLVGISLLIEKNFGKYNPINGKIGVPIRFNDKDGEPTVNFEIQCRFNDLSNRIKPDKSITEKAAIGISVGLPFSSLIY